MADVKRWHCIVFALAFTLTFDRRLMKTSAMPRFEAARDTQ